MAMYQVKRDGGAGHRVIDMRQSLLTGDHNRLENDLRCALLHEQLDVAYQPIVRSRDGLVTGVEALLRWTHPDRGPIPAISMVRAAEQIQLICEIGEWVLERSCRDSARWVRQHPGTHLDLAVNVFARQLMSSGFSGTVAAVLARTGMDPEALVLEMTENVFIEDSGSARASLADLEDLGIRLALDDFGTGYSSLSYLRRLPIHTVKIDRSLIADIGDEPTRAIVAAVTNLAHVLGLTVVAEGVETQTQREAVGAVGCEHAQGFYFARPMSASVMDAQLGASTSPLHLPKSQYAAAV